MNAEEISMLHSSFLTNIIFAILNTVGNSIPIMGLNFLMSGQNQPCFLSRVCCSQSCKGNLFVSLIMKIPGTYDSVKMVS